MEHAKTKEQVMEMLKEAEYVSVPTMIFGGKFHMRIDVPVEAFTKAMGDWGNDKIPMCWYSHDPETKMLVVYATPAFNKLMHQTAGMDV